MLYGLSLSFLYQCDKEDALLWILGINPPRIIIAYPDELIKNWLSPIQLWKAIDDHSSELSVECPLSFHTLQHDIGDSPIARRERVRPA